MPLKMPSIFRSFCLSLNVISVISYKIYNLDHIDGLVRHCNVSIANALEMLQSCNRPSILADRTDILIYRLRNGVFLTTPITSTSYDVSEY